VKNNERDYIKDFGAYIDSMVCLYITGDDFSAYKSIGLRQGQQNVDVVLDEIV
jgi:hypothetical protein